MIPRSLVLLLQEWETVKLDHCISNTVPVERVADRFGNQEDNLWSLATLRGAWMGLSVDMKADELNEAAPKTILVQEVTDHDGQNVCQGAGKLKHDDDNSDGQASHATVHVSDPPPFPQVLIRSRVRHIQRRKHTSGKQRRPRRHRSRA